MWITETRGKMGILIMETQSAQMVSFKHNYFCNSFLYDSYVVSILQTAIKYFFSDNWE